MSVIFRHVESRLEPMVRVGGGGVTVSQALWTAEENLWAIEGDCKAELDRRLASLFMFADRPPEVRPSAAEFQALVREANAALTACGALNALLLGQSLVLLCAMTDALANTTYWPTGALTPALDLIWLIWSNKLSAADAQTVIAELNRCQVQYSKYPQAL